MYLMMYFLLHNCFLSYSQTSQKYWYVSSFSNNLEKIVLFGSSRIQNPAPWYFEWFDSLEKCIHFQETGQGSFDFKNTLDLVS